jgi:hypothetical protein
MKALPFGKPGNWYRGNLHTHSTNSDGQKSPRDVCAVYRRKGYDFISLTDHFLDRYNFPVTDTSPYRTDGFTTIYGAELHAPKTSLGDLWHVLAVGLPLDFRTTGKKETGAQLANRAKAAGAYVAVAHPAWYDLTDRDVLSIKSASAIEILNTTCVEHNGKGDSVGYLDRLLSQGKRYHAIATDDAHFNPKRPDWAQNWVVVKGKRLQPESLLDALHKGHFYASQGPQILDVKFLRGKKVRVRTSPVRAMRLSGKGASADFANKSKDFTQAELSLSSLTGGYGRLTVIDKRGRKAWTNPFWT